MKTLDILALLFTLAGLTLLPYAAEQAANARIAKSCRVAGVVEIDGAVFKCKEKPTT